MRNSNVSPESTAGSASPLSQRRSESNNSLPPAFVNCGLLTNFLEPMRQDGFARVRGVLPSQRQFSAIYSLFDQLTYGAAHSEWRDSIHLEAENWASMKGNSKAYSSAPVGFRDRRVRAEKENKIYFQYCREFQHYLMSFADSSYYQNPMFGAFCDKLFDLSNRAERTFRSVLSELDAVSPSTSKAISQNHENLSVLLKVLTYEPRSDWATTPHFDKSAFTLVMNADDMENESFRIAAYEKGIKADQLKEPSRRVGSDTKPGVGLLFPGLCLRAVGVDLMPSPHGVVPFAENRRRHSVIAFLIAPNVDTSNMDTDGFDDIDRSFQN